MRTRWVLAVPALLGALMALEPRADADTGFALDRFEPAARGSVWFSQDSLDLEGRLRPALGVVADYAFRPLVIYDPTGSERSALVRHQLFTHLGASVVLSSRFRLAANLPIAVYQDGDGGSLNGVRYTSPTQPALGDLRLDADVRLVGAHGDPFTAAFGAQVHLPTGDRSSYAGDGSVRVTPHLLAAGEVGLFAYAATLGFVFHAQTDAYAGVPLGSELLLGGSAGFLAADKKLLVGPEVYGRTVVTDSNAAFGKHQSPVEALLGIHLSLGDLRLGAGGGAGLTQGFGSPELRIVGSVDWAPAVPAPPRAVHDRDHDGIPDEEDACPDDPGVRTKDPQTNGCPPAAPIEPDRDADGVPDSQDACPDVPGVRTDDPKTNGCPPDSDHDGIIDAEDACPDQPGIRTNDPATNGCPDPDRDKDGIPNAQDACPDEPGERSPDPKRNGCPKAVIEHGQIRIAEQVQFKTASAQILPASDGILNAVLKILVDHPEIKRVSIEGHTDNRGGAAYNKELSRKRAASVVKWLTSHGVDAARLSSIGYGQERPLDTNATDEGRQTNRRVEFHIVEGPGAETPSPDSSTAPLSPEPKTKPKAPKGSEVFTP